MHDAVALANWICSLESTKLSEIESVFQEYQAERLPIAKQTFATSQMFSKMGGKVRSLSINGKDIFRYFLTRVSCIQYVGLFGDGLERLH